MHTRIQQRARLVPVVLQAVLTVPSFFGAWYCGALVEQGYERAGLLGLVVIVAAWIALLILARR